MPVRLLLQGILQEEMDCCIQCWASDEEANLFPLVLHVAPMYMLQPVFQGGVFVVRPKHC